jgi:hypothetical protein
VLMVEHALRYATQLGWPVFPCSPKSKQPLYANPHRPGTPLRAGPDRCRGAAAPDGGCGKDGHGCLDATTDETTILRWWGRTPNANIGLATGWPGMDVVDFDIKPGQHGRLAHTLLTGRAHGLTDLLSRLYGAVRTASGGLHLYYPADPGHLQGNGAIPKWGVDFRGHGGYVVAPPSRTGTGAYQAIPVHDLHHPGTDLHGRGYAAFGQQDPATHWWADHPGTYLAPAPIRWADIQARLGAHQVVGGQAVRRPPQVERPRTGAVASTLDGLVDWLSTQTEATHNRNNALYWAAKVAQENNATPQVYRDLVAAAVTNGLAQHEAERTVESARHHHRGNA